MMRRLIAIELRKAILSKAFLVALIIGTGIALATSLINYFTIYQGTILAVSSYETKWFDPSTLTCFRYWVVADFNQVTTYLFFMLVPLLAVIPYAWSYMKERTSGYAAQIMVRTRKGAYLGAKGLATFASGFLVVAVPLVISLVVLACLIPARVPDATNAFYFGIYEVAFWSELFYNQPVLYSVCYVLLIGSFAGVWAVVVAALGCVVRNAVALISLPYLALVGIKYASDSGAFGVPHEALTPFDFLRPSGSSYAPDPWITTVFFALCLVVSGAFMLFERRRDLL